MYNFTDHELANILNHFNAIDNYTKADSCNVYKTDSNDLLLINHFDNDKWTEASLFLPSKLYNELDIKEKDKIKLVNNKYFYYPNYNEEYLLFNNDDIQIPNELTTYHYCYNYLKSYLENIKNIDYILNDNLFSKMMRNTYLLYINSESDISDISNISAKNKNQEIKDLIIIIENNNIDIVKDIIKDITCDISYLFYYNIHIFIYKNNKLSNNFKDFIDKNMYFKNINIYYIELFEEFKINTKIIVSKYLIHDLLINKELRILILFEKFNTCIFCEDITKNSISMRDIENENKYIVFNEEDNLFNNSNISNIFLIKNIYH